MVEFDRMLTDALSGVSLYNASCFPYSLSLKRWTVKTVKSQKDTKRKKHLQTKLKTQAAMSA